LPAWTAHFEVPGELERAAPGQALHCGMMLLFPGVSGSA
jgi:hypothetical protein